MSLHTWLLDQHARPTLWGQCLLALPSLGYRIGLTTVSALRSLGVGAGTALNTRVISVGNLTTGGTGKTPVVIALATALLNAGIRVVVLSRGYGARQQPKDSIPKGPEHGDEPWMIQQAIAPLGGTVLVGANRMANARHAEATLTPGVFILDDGFQHHAIGADFSIVLVDATLPLTDVRLLPAGPYREPLSALQRAHAVWTTKGSDAQRHASRHYLSQRAQQHGWQARMDDAPIVPYQFMAPLNPTILPIATAAPLPLALQQPCLAVSALAQNNGFFSMLGQTGIQIEMRCPFPDHHNYTTNDIHTLLTQAEHRPIVTTEKDWVKLAPLVAQLATPNPEQLWVLTITPQLPMASVWQWWENKPTRQ